MRDLVSKFLKDDSGATAVEYVVMASGIGLVLILAAQQIGLSLNLNYAALTASL